jgi:phosphatidylserine/phosphatidylglycerophosphate/cardiolipin synthase-like enzyme
LDGKIYPPSSWTGLGLPPPEKLKGIEMVIKSVFVLPFSVMHPKFILVDRKLAFMPSCNVSWENWFEGCIEMKGGITETLFNFWSSFWSRGGPALPPLSKNSKDIASSDESEPSDRTLVQGVPFPSKDEEIPTILLPSPHHVNPHFQPFTKSAPPPTPLNLFILNVFSHAKRNIYLQTPNLTSQPVVDALFSAIQRGIDIQIVTSSRLMILEQLITAGTITEYEVWKLLRRYRRLLQQHNQSLQNSDPEIPKVEPGVLRIGYYHPRVGAKVELEPVKSHLKCVIMDDEVTVLGSGNMDRASWYTSQELGVAFFSADFAGYVRGVIDDGLQERVRYVI